MCLIKVCGFVADENSSDYGGNSDDEGDEEEEEHRVVEIDSWLAFKGKYLVRHLRFSSFRYLYRR